MRGRPFEKGSPRTIEIARMGGRACPHKFQPGSAEAKEAGRKGGLSAENRSKFEEGSEAAKEAGRKGGNASAEKRKAEG